MTVKAGGNGGLSVCWLVYIFGLAVDWLQWSSVCLHLTQPRGWQLWLSEMFWHLLHCVVILLKMNCDLTSFIWSKTHVFYSLVHDQIPAQIHNAPWEGEEELEEKKKEEETQLYLSSHPSCISKTWSEGSEMTWNHNEKYSLTLFTSQWPPGGWLQ